MILKEHLIKDASPEIRKAIDELSKLAEVLKYDLYPVRLLDGGKFYAMPYKQEGTERGTWARFRLPNSVVHEGDGVFSLAKTK